MEVSEITATPELTSQRDTRLHGRWLALAWVGWSILTLLCLINFITSIHGYLMDVQVLCHPGSCVEGQPTQETAQMLHRLGLSVNAYAALGVGLVILAALVSCAVAVVILWRRPGDWMALLVISYLCIPLCIGFAILRYHLWDIDVIINKALVYGSLTAILALVYIGLILALQYMLRELINQNSSIAIVISTLTSATLFQPLRHRIQQVIDRRFYRRKYDAARTLAAFSATLRNEVDLTQLREHLLMVVQETMQPRHVSLWLRSPEHDGTQRSPLRSTPPVSSEGR